MKTVISLILVLILSSCASKKHKEQIAKAQYSLPIIAKKFDAKKHRYIGLTMHCSGGFPRPIDFKNDCPSCRSRNDIYFFWTENEKAYLQKFDNCSAFNIVEIKDFEPEAYLKSNSSELQNEEVGKYQTAPGVYRTTAHYCSSQYIFNDGETKFDQKFNRSDLLGEGENLNFQVNNELKLIDLDKKLNQIILAFENENRFVRNNKTCFDNGTTPIKLSSKPEFHLKL
jgi:hypothetical protein